MRRDTENSTQQRNLNNSVKVQFYLHISATVVVDLGASAVRKEATKLLAFGDIFGNRLYYGTAFAR